jgi:putative copper export protein/methionine-rich copper-binding protein CopC
MKREKKILQLISIVALVLFLPTIALSHAKLLKSNPAANSVLRVSPRLIELWFNVELQPDFNTITIKDQNNKVVETGNIRLAESNKKLELDTGPIPSGSYKVEWSILSTDEHKMRGEFSFKLDLPIGSSSVGSNQQEPPSHSSGTEHRQDNIGENLDASLPASTMHKLSSSASLQIIRWLLLLSMVSLFGAFAYRLFVFTPSILNLPNTSEENKKQVLRTNKDQLLNICWISVILLFLSMAVGLILQTAEVFDKTISQSLQVNLLYQIINRTQYGVALLLEVIGLIVLFTILHFLRRSDSNHSSWWWIGLLTSGVVLLSPGLTGHAASASRIYKLAIPVDWLHMLAVGAWVGGLLHMTLSLRSSMRNLTALQRAYVTNLIIERFNTLAVTSVALVILTGIYNSWIHIDTVSALWSTNYGQTLSIKLLVVLVMLMLGGINKLFLHARLVRSLEGLETDRQKILRNFNRSIRVEAALGVVVLIIASFLSYLPPAESDHSGMVSLWSQEP